MDTVEVTIDDRTNRMRLDQALARALPDRSRSSLARLIGQGRVRVEGQVETRPSHPVAAGQRVAIDFPPPRPAGVEPQDLPVRVLYEDADIAVIDKPAGMVVHPAAGHADSTLVNALLFHLKALSGIGGELRPGIVHRLDKQTSGVMVIAKNDAAHRALTAVWGTDRVRKEYLALVYGTPRAARGSITAPIGRDPRERKRMAVTRGGRNAVTEYEVIEPMRYLSLLRLVLHTGRTHQIRVHLKSIGHPVVGDALYSGPQWRGIPDRGLKKTLSSFPRQALHAASIAFPHPRTGQAMVFEAELPEDLRGLLRAVRG
jgi:23S rRNA pseudouridine1911/1915/1917 synthase